MRCRPHGWRPVTSRPDSRRVHRSTKAKRTSHPDNARPRQTKEGASAVKDAIQWLQKCEAAGELDKAGEGLRLAAEDHAVDVGGAGVASHRGGDDSRPEDRATRYGKWKGAVGECLWYGRATTAPRSSRTSLLMTA